MGLDCPLSELDGPAGGMSAENRVGAGFDDRRSAARLFRRTRYDTGGGVHLLKVIMALFVAS